MNDETTTLILSAVRARVVVTENVYHQEGQNKPLLIDSRFGWWLTTADQPYQRRLSVGEEWECLDTGWLEGKFSMVIVSNEEGKFYHRIPTKEEKGAVAERAIEVGFGYLNEIGALRILPCLEVLSGHAERIRPVQGSRVVLRCRNGSAKATVTVLPL